MVFDILFNLWIYHRRNISALAQSFPHKARGKLYRLGDNSADDGVIFFGIFADLFKYLVRYEGIVLTADIYGVA